MYQRSPAVCEVLKYQEKMNHFNAGFKVVLHEKHHRGSLQSFECDHKINLYVLNMIIATVNKHNYFPRVEHRTLVCNPDHFTTQRDCRDPNPGPSTVMSYHSFLKWCNFFKCKPAVTFYM